VEESDSDCECPDPTDPSNQVDDTPNHVQLREEQANEAMDVPIRHRLQQDPPFQALVNGSGGAVYGLNTGQIDGM
jgi:hypothetical protein